MGIFRREIRFEVDEAPDGRIFIEGTLRDTRLGDPIHVIKVRSEVDALEGRILALEGEMLHVPHEDCRHALQTIDRLVGVRIVPGFTQLVREVVGSPEGCSHLAVLVTNLGHVSVQGRGALVVHKFGGDERAVRLMREQALQLGIVDNCYTWRKDGPLVKRLREAAGRDGGAAGDSGGEPV
ncbi:MAG: DUF2889 domain-containing protein [Actinobacteria bacterium]|nr:DUF2889 domain-containing protein [Actinomycetota bacterium]